MGMTNWPESGMAVLSGSTYHARRGGPVNSFCYRVDYVLCRLHPPAAPSSPLLRQSRGGLLTVLDRDHGSGEGSMVEWALGHARAHGLPEDAAAEVWLLTQPRSLGFLFNPVSFWVFRDATGAVRAVLAEVNNTFGDRHSYLCALPDFRAIAGDHAIEAQKVFHVSPFQQVSGTYTFTFDLQTAQISIKIDHQRGGQGVIATLAGPLCPATTRILLKMMLRRPLGALRVFGLIHWQAIKLKLKGARYRVQPPAPTEEVSR
jgi:uncharacterized protein